MKKPEAAVIVLAVLLIAGATRDLRSQIPKK